MKHVYMLRKKGTTAYYHRGGWWCDWLGAAVWTTVRGPSSAMAQMKKKTWLGYGNCDFGGDRMIPVLIVCLGLAVWLTVIAFSLGYAVDLLAEDRFVWAFVMFVFTITLFLYGISGLAWLGGEFN